MNLRHGESKTAICSREKITTQGTHGPGIPARSLEISLFCLHFWLKGGVNDVLQCIYDWRNHNPKSGDYVVLDSCMGIGVRERDLR